MSNIVTYKTLELQSLVNVSIDYSVIKQNFTIMNQFIKSFSTFQKKFNDMQKQQKALTQQVSQFKLSTQSQLTTMNQILQSRGQISQNKSSAANQQINEIKKSIKQSTRQQHQAQQIRQKQYVMKNINIDKEINKLKQQLVQQIENNKRLQSKLEELTIVTARKQQLSQVIFNLEQQKSSAQELKEHIQQIDKLLTNTKVEQFKTIIDQINQSTKKEINQMKVKLNTRATLTDLLKLEEMLLAVNQYGVSEILKIMAHKVQTKKALTFLQKRINSLLVLTLGENQQQRQGLLTSKQIKCISCSKDLGQAEGKLDKVKNWSVFPAKQSVIKQKYAGFGAGFQTIIQSTIAKKGGQVKYDEKGRMIQPFNLTGTIQGSLMRSSKSQHKIQLSDSKSKLINNSPSKGSLKYQTSFMYQYGKQSSQQHGINITEEYYNRFRGLQSFVMANKKNQSKEEK